MLAPASTHVEVTFQKYDLIITLANVSCCKSSRQGLGRIWFFLPDTGYPAELFSLPCRMIRLFLARAGNPALPDIRSNPNSNKTEQEGWTNRTKITAILVERKINGKILG